MWTFYRPGCNVKSHLDFESRSLHVWMAYTQDRRERCDQPAVAQLPIRNAFRYWNPYLCRGHAEGVNRTKLWSFDHAMPWVTV